MKRMITIAATVGLTSFVILLTAFLGSLASSEVYANTNTTPSTGTITLNLDETSIVGEGASIDGQVITITTAGTYTIQGELTDGRIVVDAADVDDVTLILSDATIRCSNFAPIYVANANEVVILLAEGTSNYVEDGKMYVLDKGEDEPNAAIFSHDDLTIAGSGSLIVAANFNNGIQSKDDLLIESGNITVIAVNDGLKGRDSITVLDANITVDAGGDGLQSNNDEDPTKGVITIESGAIAIEAGADGIQAQTALTVNGGDLNLVTGGGSANSSTQSGWGSWGQQGTTSTATTSASAKGLKAGSSLTINGGTIEIDSSDDAIHSNDTLVINDGEIVISSGDDGIHADSSLTINAGDITIDKSYEGIESMDISLNGGTIYVTASDDGINGAGGNDSSALGERPGQNMFNESTNCTMAIRGGYIYVDAVGDGLDVNGPITMTGGTVVLNAPTDDRDGALDWTGSFDISGGYLIAAGSYGRTTQAPSTTSSQNSVLVNLTSAVSASTFIHIEDEDGGSVVTFQPTKTWQSFLLSTSTLESGETYNVTIGGSASGTSTDGVYSDGTYSSGTSVGSFSISSAVTLLGSQSSTVAPPAPGGGRP